MIKTLLTLVVGLSLAGTAAAQTSADVDASANVRASVTTTAPGRVVPPQFRDRLEQLRKDRLDLLRGSTSTEERREKMEGLREKFQNVMEERREAMKDQIATHREELKKRLEAMKDKRKTSIAERVDGQLAKLNERLTDHLAKVLNKLDDVLARIEERTQKAADAGKDVSSVRTAISAAHDVIASARAAVTAQAGKTYGVQVTTEANLRVDVKTARDAIHADLREVQDLVKAARDAVRKAAVALAQVRGIDEVSTTTATSTP